MEGFLIGMVKICSLPIHETSDDKITGRELLIKYESA
jgi:hypothetical protein